LTEESETCSGEKTASLTNGAGNTGPFTCKKLKLEPYLSTCVKLNLKYISDPHVRPENLKL
jgi:hypothetical protein